MYAECGSDAAAAGGDSLPYNEDFIIIHSITAVKDWVVRRGKTGGCSGPLYHVPQDKFEWIALLKRAGVDVIGVQARCDSSGCLVRVLVPGGAARWVCAIDFCRSERSCCRLLCCHYCEMLMLDCAVLGQGRPEQFPGTTLAEMRIRIAKAVAAELC